MYCTYKSNSFKSTTQTFSSSQVLLRTPSPVGAPGISGAVPRHGPQAPRSSLHDHLNTCHAGCPLYGNGNATLTGHSPQVNGWRLQEGMYQDYWFVEMSRFSTSNMRRYVLWNRQMYWFSTRKISWFMIWNRKIYWFSATKWFSLWLGNNKSIMKFLWFFSLHQSRKLDTIDLSQFWLWITRGLIKSMILIRL